ncbi:MAG: L,D-transpeptidase [Nitrosomonas sp.]|uniref:L,D-transpeptidase n=1 Tax=Nitrosomonas sp. TaxID=42353 RepID=UPI0027194C75|nr:L,D-transpeptidase [Nitrosomonas sp.]MDO8893523.1 L,D-transpeptidase [Nitrosomonas sp.]MDO9469356.1 L,D-transpeptidase [Nitrosomonas sp.]MDP2224143.1 L,D-transpeptidase [Nitrosomonas sp.]MDP3279674.1 L,D-transpeptidase [Nitrosomonas sp.]MDZ4106282.1 L,D-transpeptidase [Nitrosomonas sp.]
MTKQNSFILYLVILLIGLLGLSVIPNSVRADNGIWIDVDTSTHTLSVMQGNAIQTVFKNVAIGRYGTTWSKMTKDDKTPLGRFRVGWINEKSRYYRFFGLNYPNLDTAKRALDENRITEETWLSILEAKSMGKTPPQNTPLGGHIGIHGIGRGDQEIHHEYNWTNGCIALTNEQIDQLGKWIKPGILVNIR